MRTVCAVCATPFDTPDNVAPAHFACNLRKSNKTGEALTAVS